jgi:hypothetical protein
MPFAVDWIGFPPPPHHTQAKLLPAKTERMKKETHKEWSNVCWQEGGGSSNRRKTLSFLLNLFLWSSYPIPPLLCTIWDLFFSFRENNKFVERRAELSLYIVSRVFVRQPQIRWLVWRYNFSCHSFLLKYTFGYTFTRTMGLSR